jgi:hypothetical protein
MKVNLAYLHRLKKLCQGSAEAVDWLEEDKRAWSLFCLGWVLGGFFIYGFTIGLWRAPLQGLWAAIKSPVLIAATLSGTAAANWMLASLLGARFSFRQSLVIQLMGYAVMVTILLSLAPIGLFMDWAAPSATGPGKMLGHAIITIFQVTVIAGVGIASHVRLFHLLSRVCRDKTIARLIFLAWLAENLLLGSQLSWYLRPFIGKPTIPVEFYCDEALVKGSFYDDLTEKVSRLAK